MKKDELVTSGSVELIEVGVVVVVVIGLVGIGVEGATGSSSSGMSTEVPLPGTPAVALVVAVVDRLPPIPSFMFVFEVLEASGSVELVRDVSKELVVEGRMPPIAPSVA